MLIVKQIAEYRVYQPTMLPRKNWGLQTVAPEERW